MSPTRPDKHDDVNSAGRKTRAPYIQRACIECKRRKQRCSGHDPCKNCESRSVDCHYAASDGGGGQPGSLDYLKTVTSQMHSLSELVESMQAEIRTLKSVKQVAQLQVPMAEKEQPDNAMAPTEQGRFKKRKLQTPETLAVSPPQELGPRYQGSTSAEYSLQLTSLQLSHIENPTAINSSNLEACYDREEEAITTTDANLKHHGHLPCQAPGALERVSVRVFSEIPHSRAKALVTLYSEAVGSLHPIVDIPIVLDRLDGLYTQIENVTHGCGSHTTSRYDVIVIRLILAIALLSEQSQNASLVEDCYEGVEQELNGLLHSEKVSLRGVILVILGSLYHLFSDRVRMAWRLCGTAASLAMELGLHRPETLQRVFSNENERLKAVRVMWSIFILDHGWSSALGLPRNIDDTALDGAQPPPHDSPYLRAMSSYCSISTKIVGSTSKIPINPDLYEEENFMFLNYQIDRWQESSLSGFASSLRDKERITYDPLDPVQTLLYLRANQLRILLLRPLFFSESSVKPDQAKVSASLEAATRTISAVYHLHATTNYYRKQHPFFSHLVTSAASLIFLVITFQSSEELTAQTGPLYLPHAATQPLAEVLELTSTHASFSIHAKQLHRRLTSIISLLIRLKILPSDLTAQHGERDGRSIGPGQFTSPILSDFSMPENPNQFVYTSPALTVPEPSCQQQDDMSHFPPFCQDDSSEMSSFLNDTIWSELDKLLAPCRGFGEQVPSLASGHLGPQDLGAG